MRRLPFPKAYIILTMGRRGRLIKKRLKSLNSITIKLIVEVVYIAVRILIGVSVRAFIRGWKRAKRDTK